MRAIALFIMLTGVQLEAAIRGRDIPTIGTEADIMGGIFILFVFCLIGGW